MDNPFGAPMTSAMVEPFVGGAAIHLHQDGFAERGGLAGLSAPGQSSDVETTTLGVRLEAALATAVPLTARAMVGWRHAYGDVTPEAALVFAGGSDFTVAGAPLHRNALVTEFGLDTNFSQRVSFGLSYAGQFGTRASDDAVNARLTVKFSWLVVKIHKNDRLTAHGREGRGVASAMKALEGVPGRHDPATHSVRNSQRC
jgi:fibronectin-binding autotransporter adhesin